MNSSILRQLKKIAGKDAVLDRLEDRRLYEYDGGIDRSVPGAVVFGLNAEQISRVMRFANANKIPVVPRGAGTGLSGGAIAEKEAIVLSTARMKKILEIDITNKRDEVQPGVVSVELVSATVKTGYSCAS